MREWRHILTMRCATAAHPQMRDMAIKSLSLLYAAVPVIFEDLAAQIWPRKTNRQLRS
jgi:thymidylate synthase (FAD)